MSGKKALRAFIRRQTAELTEEESLRLSSSVMARLERHPKFREARTVLCYHSLPDEVCTHALIDRYAETKTILLPVVEGEELKLRVYGGPASLRHGAFGIAEPAGQDFTSLPDIDLIIVPGLAFDACGHRLGRGKGYYDRLLAKPGLQAAYRLAVCFPFQFVREVPVETHDLAVDEVLH